MSRLEKLPPEIRNMIYFLVLVSPTGYIEPISRNHAYYLRLPGSTSRSGPHWYLTATSPSQHTTLDEKLSRRRNPPSNGGDTALETSSRISTSLLRTNKAIYQETFPIFWKNNTFLFGDLGGVKQFQQGAGQIPFGNIHSLNIVIRHNLSSIDTLLAPLVKIKRTSNSNLNEQKVFKYELKKLELSFKRPFLGRMLDWQFGYSPLLSWVQREKLYRESLRQLEGAKKMCGEVGIKAGILALFGDMKYNEMMLYKEIMDDVYEVFEEDLRFDDWEEARWSESEHDMEEISSV